VAGADDVFGLDAVEVPALVLDNAIVAGLDRPVAGARNDRIRMDAGATGVAAMACWRERWQLFQINYDIPSQTQQGVNAAWVHHPE
jgi:hypothetical protein